MAAEQAQPIKIRRGAMCDYSLEHVASREAEVGDHLITTRFENCITRGFCAEKDPATAVCLRPGTELAFDGPVEFDNFLWCKNELVEYRVARFRQIDTESRLVHHDALEFPDGQVVLITRLIEGQRATVLQLPAGQEERANNVEMVAVV